MNASELKNGHFAFDLEVSEKIDSIWWQISENNDFSVILPNFDRIQEPDARVAIDPLSSTFLNAATLYYFRARVRRDGVWSDWCATVPFEVVKPSTPSNCKFEESGTGIALVWKGEQGCEFLIFGSNRLDFVPEIYSPREATEIRSAAEEKTRPNRNLLAVTTRTRFEFESGKRWRFFRIIARRGQVLSVPTSLLRFPSRFAADLPEAVVLQTRHQRIENEKQGAGYRDDYLAKELPVRR